MHYISLGNLADFAPGRMRAYRLDESEIAVVQYDGRFYAFDNRCTHRQEYLTDGFIIDGQVICGLHEATYDLVDGAIAYGPAFEPLAVYPTRVEGDEVQVGWPQALTPDVIAYVDHDGEERSSW